eukprot:833188-Alexandrium_andersonii.AAC.1
MNLAIERDDRAPVALEVELPRVQCEAFHRRKAPVCNVKALAKPETQATLEACLRDIPPHPVGCGLRHTCSTLGRGYPQGGQRSQPRG